MMPLEQTKESLAKKLKQHLEQLPVLPTVVVQLMGLDADAGDYFERVRKIVESEPNFSMRLLVAANSAVHAGRAPVATVSEALIRIGSRSASNLLLSLAVARVFIPRDPWEKSLWRHALQVATMARALAHSCVDPLVPPEEAYLCGLLHDVGRFVMFDQAPEALRKIDEAAWETPQALVDMERSICGLSHSDLGALACEHWHLPETIVYVVGQHHQHLGPSPKLKREKLAALVQVADVAMFPSAVPGMASLSEADQQTLEEGIRRRMPDFLKPYASNLHGLMRTSSEETEVLCRSLGVA